MSKELNCPTMLSIRKTAELGMLSERALRTMLKRNQLPGVNLGYKFLINVDKLILMVSQVPNESQVIIHE